MLRLYSQRLNPSRTTLIANELKAMRPHFIPVILTWQCDRPMIENTLAISEIKRCKMSGNMETFVERWAAVSATHSL